MLYAIKQWKTQEIESMHDDTRLVPDWFVTSNMIENLSLVFSNDDLVFDDLSSNFATFFSKDISLNSITLGNINLDNDNFD